jgi:hypothetical protein
VGPTSSSTFQCKTCECVLPVSDFYKRKGGRIGHFSECKKCYLARSRAWHQTNPERCRASQLKYRFGITPADYDRLLQKQEGACAICGCKCTTGKRLAVDHDHETGAVRGLLCLPCNTALGAFKDQPELLRAAISYLLTPPNHAQ